MSGANWRSEEAYPNAKKVETVDIAWEWLRRDGEYRRAYEALVSDQRSSGMTDGFREQWGLSFRG
jgi:hypothetical protein